MNSIHIFNIGKLRLGGGEGLPQGPPSRSGQPDATAALPGAPPSRAEAAPGAATRESAAPPGPREAPRGPVTGPQTGSPSPDVAPSAPPRHPASQATLSASSAAWPLPLCAHRLPVGGPDGASHTPATRGRPRGLLGLGRLATGGVDTGHPTAETRPAPTLSLPGVVLSELILGTNSLCSPPTSVRRVLPSSPFH